MEQIEAGSRIKSTATFTTDDSSVLLVGEVSCRWMLNGVVTTATPVATATPNVFYAIADIPDTAKAGDVQFRWEADSATVRIRSEGPSDQVRVVASSFPSP